MKTIRKILGIPPRENQFQIMNKVIRLPLFPEKAYIYFEQSYSIRFFTCIKISPTLYLVGEVADKKIEFQVSKAFESN